MLDIDFIKENPEKIKQAAQSKGVEVDIDLLLELDEKRRDLKTELDNLRAKQNKLTEKVEKASEKKRESLIDKIKPLKEEIQEKEEQWKKVKKEWNSLMLQIPNLPASNTPEGKTEEDNVVIRKWGKKPKFSKPKNHLELGEKFNLIDVERAAKVSGARFGFLKNEAALLEFALIRFSFDFLIEKDFIPIVPPVLLKPEVMSGLGYLEQGREEIYYLEKDNLYLAGTAEHPIGAMHANEVLKELPKRYVGFSSCFRREAGSYGKKTRGIFRVHQFDKVEMFSFCNPRQSEKEHQFLLSLQEELMKQLKIPYQVVQMCTADLGFPVSSKYDIEAWIPSQNKYRETHSTSNCTDFQARRLGIKFRDGGKLKFAHTVNGTAFAIGRTLIAILENYQKEDHIEIPKALQKYLGFKKISL